jgi:cell wall-associated NlpC family hydrolase
MNASSLRRLVFSFALICFMCESSRADNGNSSTNDAAPPIPPDSTNSPVASAPATTIHVATLTVADLREYEMQPAQVQLLLASALKLTTLDLGYQDGSSDPAAGGMDCSGTVYYLLRAAGLKDVPREASGMYKWVWQQSRFEAVTSSHSDTFELEPLKPGDLLFWTGTYAVERDPPVTHVMIYLGINRHTGRRVMVGASEGRRFDDQSMYGVSVFDFTLPRAKPSASESSRFIGYGAIPGLASLPSTANPQK